MANLKTLTIDGVSTDNYHPATLTVETKTLSLASGTVRFWDTGFILAKGFWLVNATITFPASSTGTRYLQLGMNDEGGFANKSAMRVPAAPSGDTILFGFCDANSDGTATLACRIFQNSGSTQNVTLTYNARLFPTLLG